MDYLGKYQNKHTRENRKKENPGGRDDWEKVKKSTGRKGEGGPKKVCETGNGNFEGSNV